MLRDDELENGVAEKLEPLVIELPALLLVPYARVGERLDQQLGIAKAMTNALFQRMRRSAHSLGRAPWLLRIHTDRCNHIDRPLQDGVMRRRLFPARPPLLVRLHCFDLGIGAGKQSGFV